MAQNIISSQVIAYFLLKNHRTVDTVYTFLTKTDEKKSVGLNNIPNKLLKIGVNVVTPFHSIYQYDNLSTRMEGEHGVTSLQK